MRQLCVAACVAGAFVIAGGTPAVADKAPWCAFLGGTDAGMTECLYYSREQCQATLSGFGGYCFRNQTIGRSRSSRERSRY